jgi:hypothetical protein
MTPLRVSDPRAYDKSETYAVSIVNAFYSLYDENKRHASVFSAKLVLVCEIRQGPVVRTDTFFVSDPMRIEDMLDLFNVGSPEELIGREQPARFRYGGLDFINNALDASSESNGDTDKPKNWSYKRSLTQRELGQSLIRNSSSGRIDESLLYVCDASRTSKDYLTLSIIRARLESLDPPLHFGRDFFQIANREYSTDAERIRSITNPSDSLDGQRLLNPDDIYRLMIAIEYTREARFIHQNPDYERHHAAQVLYSCGLPIIQLGSQYVLAPGSKSVLDLEKSLSDMPGEFEEIATKARQLSQELGPFIPAQKLSGRLSTSASLENITSLPLYEIHQKHRVPAYSAFELAQNNLISH